MKIKKLLIPVLVVAAVAVYASEGNNYKKESGKKQNTGSCHSSGDSCTITETISWPCDGSSETTCYPVPPTPASIPGTCSWVPPQGRQPGRWSCTPTSS